MKTVVITGASGLLGRALCRAFKSDSWNVVGLAHTRARDGLLAVDLTDFDQTTQVIHQAKPDIIVHSAAQRFPDKVEQDYEASRKLNVDAAKNLAEFAGRSGISLIHISTDYVFDGKNPPYREFDRPCPPNKYGRSKADAEDAVTQAKPDAVVLRIPVLYGNEEYEGESAVACLLKAIKDRSKRTKVSDYEVRYPSHVGDIADIVVQLADRRLRDDSIRGPYNWCGSEPLTRYGMIQIIGRVLGLEVGHVEADPNPSPGAPRPRDSRLSCERLRDLDVGRHTPFEEGVEGFRKFL